MEHLDLESCKRYKTLGGPQEADWWWDRAFRAVPRLIRPQYVPPQGIHDPVLAQYWLACPDPMAVLEFLRHRAPYTMDFSFGDDRIAVCLWSWSPDDDMDTEQGLNDSFAMSVEAIAALLKAVAEREGVKIDG